MSKGQDYYSEGDEPSLLKLTIIINLLYKFNIFNPIKQVLINIF